MAEHDPVEDALNARKRQARLVEAGGAFSQNTLDTTRQFLSDGIPQRPPVRQFVGPSGRGLPSTASDIARSRFGGQQGRENRQQQLIPPVRDVPTSSPPIRETRGLERGIAQNQLESARDTLSNRFFDLPGPVGFSRTAQGKKLLQRILSLRGLR